VYKRQVRDFHPPEKFAHTWYSACGFQWACEYFGAKDASHFGVKGATRFGLKDASHFGVKYASKLVNILHNPG